MEVRWADLDPNFHMRHSVYYDLGAQCRVEYLQKSGITAQFMHEHQFGPILFREECLFKREILLGDHVLIDLELYRSKRDFSRWTMKHRILRTPTELAALITVEGAWMDKVRRKLIIPPREVLVALEAGPRDSSFEWIE
jgi:acyl-CoA thioester hydrolase